MGVGNSKVWGGYSAVGSETDSAYRITFGIDDEYNLGYSYGFIDFLNDGKPVGLLIYYSIE